LTVLCTQEKGEGERERERENNDAREALADKRSQPRIHHLLHSVQATSKKKKKPRMICRLAIYIAKCVVA